MKTRNYYLLAVVAIVAGLNLFLSVNGQSLVADLKLLTVEAVANAEYNPYAPLGEELKTHHCPVIMDEIVAVLPDGSILTETRVYDGLEGECTLGTDRCTPFSCTKFAQ